MKITHVEAMICDAGWRPWTFVKIQTDNGLTGYGECSDNRTPRAIAGCVEDLKSLLLGQDPRPIEKVYWDMYRATRQSPAVSRRRRWRASIAPCGISKPRPWASRCSNCSVAPRVIRCAYTVALRDDTSTLRQSARHAVAAHAG
jgi:hypothetical protein